MHIVFKQHLNITRIYIKGKAKSFLKKIKKVVDTWGTTCYNEVTESKKMLGGKIMKNPVLVSATHVIEKSLIFVYEYDYIRMDDPKTGKIISQKIANFKKYRNKGWSDNNDNV